MLTVSDKTSCTASFLQHQSLSLGLKPSIHESVEPLKDGKKIGMLNLEMYRLDASFLVGCADGCW